MATWVQRYISLRHPLRHSLRLGLLSSGRVWSVAPCLPASAVRLHSFEQHVKAHSSNNIANSRLMQSPNCLLIANQTEPYPGRRVRSSICFSTALSGGGQVHGPARPNSSFFVVSTWLALRTGHYFRLRNYRATQQRTQRQCIAHGSTVCVRSSLAISLSFASIIRSTLEPWLILI